MPLDATRFAPTVPRSGEAITMVTVYGTVRCGRTFQIRRALRQTGVGFRYIDLDLHRAARRHLQQCAGPDFATPVIHLDEEWLIAPTVLELRDALTRHGLG